MPETIRNRILAVALMAVLVLVSISPATVLVQAQEVYVHDSRVVESTTTSDCAVTKHETVYVNLAADGAVKQVNVSDHLHTELPQVRIEDASDLSDITDVKTGETPERSNGRLFWQMDGTDLYYSGRSDSTPPMQFDIDYMINGVPIAPDQLAGKSGRLTIRVEAENTLVKPVTVNGVSYDLTCPMLLVGGMLLPEEGFENVEVSNGAVLGDGAHRIVLLMGVPGMEESLGISALGLPLLGEQMGAGSFTITADVKNFAMGNMMFAAVPFSSVDAFTSGDLSEGLDGVKQIFSDLETVMNAFSSMRMQELVQMLYGDMDKVQNLMGAVTQAALLYDENKALLETLSGYVTYENLAAMEKLLADMEAIDVERLQALIDCNLFQQLIDLISLIDEEARDLVTVTEDALALMPTIDALKADLADPALQSSIERLPEIISQLRGVIQVLEANREVFDDLAVLQDSNITNGLQTILGVASKYSALDGLTQAQQQNLAGRMREWLTFGEEYDIFTQRTENTESSVAFVYKVQAIG